MAIFNSYVSLPEGTLNVYILEKQWLNARNTIYFGTFATVSLSEGVQVGFGWVPFKTWLAGHFFESCGNQEN